MHIHTHTYTYTFPIRHSLSPATDRGIGPRKEKRNLRNAALAKAAKRKQETEKNKREMSKRRNGKMGNGRNRRDNSYYEYCICIYT